jgi:CubicO group peptidase (beta-lactamase class C family)
MIHTRLRRFALALACLAAVLVAAPFAGVPIAQERTTSTATASTGSRTPRTGARDLAIAAPESVGISSERLRRLDAGMKQVVDQKRIAGIVTMLARHGKVVDFNAVGTKDVRSGEPVQKDSIFRIYSMTKVVTGAAMMMLYEEGKWRLDDPVSRYIPEFARMKVYTGENPDGTPKLEDARRPMMMRELMTHTAGLGYVLSPNNPVDRMFIQNRVLNPELPLQSMIDAMAKVPLLAQPGTRWSYSAAVDVQGYLIEKLSGQSFGDFLRTRIFEPLGMKDTAFYVPKDKLPRLAQVHGEQQGGGLAVDTNRPDPLMVPKGPSGGGGLYSTASDYMRFAEMLLEGGQFNGVRLLAPRTVEMMRTNHVNPEPLKTMGPGVGWGLGPQVIMDAAAAGEPYSNGSFTWFGIAGTWFWIDPVEDFAFVGMLQHQQLPAARAVHSLSHQLVYQAIVD